MDIRISIVLKDKDYGFSDLLGGRELNQQTKQEIIDLIKEDIVYVFDQQIEVEQCNTGVSMYCDCDKWLDRYEEANNSCNTCNRPIH